MRMPWSTQPLCSQGVDSAVPPAHTQEQHSPIPLNAPPTLASALLRRASCFCFSQPQNKIPLHPRERRKQLGAEFVPPQRPLQPQPVLHSCRVPLATARTQAAQNSQNTPKSSPFPCQPSLNCHTAAAQEYRIHRRRQKLLQAHSNQMTKTPHM